MTESSKLFKRLERKWKIPKKIVKKGIIKDSTKFGTFVIGSPLAMKNILISSISDINHYWPSWSKYDHINRKILLFDYYNLLKYCKQLIEVNNHDVYELNLDRRLIHTITMLDIHRIIKKHNKELQKSKTKKP